ncbi:hypothetical protein SFRURICE_010954 [Spodoptera frugiperda]|nr:hypothetical protein SFRURICE_010954 [Spodoptera frugiperda]
MGHFCPPKLRQAALYPCVRRVAFCTRLKEPSDHHRWGLGLMPDPELRTTKRVYRGSGSKGRSRNGVEKDDFSPLKKKMANLYHKKSQWTLQNIKHAVKMVESGIMVRGLAPFTAINKIFLKKDPRIAILTAPSKEWFDYTKARSVAILATEQKAGLIRLADGGVPMTSKMLHGLHDVELAKSDL